MNPHLTHTTPKTAPSSDYYFNYFRTQNDKILVLAEISVLAIFHIFAMYYIEMHWCERVLTLDTF